MDDREVVEAFAYGARQAYGPTLHIEGDALLLNGWWQAAFRVTPDAFIVRSEEPPEETPVIGLVQEALRDRGFVQALDDHPLVQAITYTELSLAGVLWAVWAEDADAARAALAQRVGAESTPRDWLSSDEAVVTDLSAELEGARRIADLPPAVILAVGLTSGQVLQLQVGIPQARVESRALGEIQPESCSDIGATVIVVDATERSGLEFIMELRAAACGRFLPVAAVIRSESPPAGADVALDPGEPASTWTRELVRMLP